MTASIRKIIVQVDETRIEMGKTIDPPKIGRAHV